VKRVQLHCIKALALTLTLTLTLAVSAPLRESQYVRTQYRGYEGMYSNKPRDMGNGSDAMVGNSLAGISTGASELPPRPQTPSPNPTRAKQSKVSFLQDQSRGGSRSSHMYTVLCSRTR
jgi:hypothetical protein